MEDFEAINGALKSIGEIRQSMRNMADGWCFVFGTQKGDQTVCWSDVAMCPVGSV
jgi:hypothetical protein